MSYNIQETTGQKWLMAWRSPGFRNKTLLGLAAIGAILCVLPIFFETIEKRQGMAIHDWVLNILPAWDGSVPIFICIWSMSFIMLVRGIQSPQVFLTFLWGYVFLCLSRIVTISLVPLEPPVDLIPLTDRLANTFYGQHFVTRDLFYSGHTATVFLIFLCLKKKTEKLLALMSTITVGILLLIQHVHFTIDVLAAPVFVYLLFLVAQRIARERPGESFYQNASPN